MFGCTLAFHNGVTPLFTAFRECRGWKLVAVFCAVQTALWLSTGCSPWVFAQLPCYGLAYLIAKRSAVASCVAFYLVSNTVCFFTMPIYAGLHGYVACMLAGLPFALNSLASTVVFSTAVKMFKEYAEIRYPALAL